MTYTFPDNFLWGSSISAYQAEGGLLEDGRKLSTADFSTRKEHYCDNSVTSDFYHHYTAVSYTHLDVYKRQPVSMQQLHGGHLFPAPQTFFPSGL